MRLSECTFYSIMCPCKSSWLCFLIRFCRFCFLFTEKRHASYSWAWAKAYKKQPAYKLEHRITVQLCLCGFYADWALGTLCGLLGQMNARFGHLQKYTFIRQRPTYTFRNSVRMDRVRSGCNRSWLISFKVIIVV